VKGSREDKLITVRGERERQSRERQRQRQREMGEAEEKCKI
jgi:hypothetical protein